MSQDTPVLAIDADVLIFALSPHHRLGRITAPLFDENAPFALLGSTLLLTEALVRPLVSADDAAVEHLLANLARAELFSPDEDITLHAAWLGTSYRLKTVDAIHLSTAILRGADTFLTNNRRDFIRAEIVEIPVLYPEDLDRR